MSSPDPGPDVWAEGAAPLSSPVAWISRSALAVNARAARSEGIRLFSPAIMAADAWGHGADLVAEVLATEGFAPARDVLASTPAIGVEAPTAQRSTAIAPQTLFGLPGPRPTKPVMRMTGTVLSVKDLRAGEGVSYGYAYRAAADTRVALVTGGYAQGVVRALGGAAEVAIGAQRHPVIGRVAMDVCVVEIRDAAVRRGDEVVFFGDPAQGEPSLRDWARVTGLSVMELITTVGLRAVRQDTP
ncbi:alanine racemase C-terminal domain-containing protein [Microbacterium sp. I2]|uniref:alanine racemase C-terminal domain-containing protein n=1 Tax=Microbacterium sp. I2 TaxID=3391826 RepID=UPI003EDB450B